MFWSKTKKRIEELENKVASMTASPQHALVDVVCMQTECPYNSGSSYGFYCRAKAIVIADGKCCSQNGEFPIDEQIDRKRYSSCDLCHNGKSCKKSSKS